MKAGFLKQYKSSTPPLLSACLVLCLFLTEIGSDQARGDQSFAVALPELEGPLTLGIFIERKELIRLLYRNAPMESIPGGLNGLIMSWDEKDDRGRPVNAGNYTARGIVHGPLFISCLPFSELRNGPILPEELFALFELSPMPLSGNTITVRAARDALLEKSPLLTVSASLEENACVLAVEGLPLLSVPLKDSGSPQRIRLFHGHEEGVASLMIEDTRGTSTYEITGLGRLVPLSAGKIEVFPDAFHSSPSTEDSAHQ